MKRASQEHPVAKWLLIGAVFAFVVFFLVFPVCVVLYEALRLGFAAYAGALGAPLSVSAVRLTLLVAIAVVPLNTIFGICAAWAVTHFQFRGKALLISLIEIPLWVSPVIGGLVFALLFGLFFGGIRVLLTRYFPGTVLDLPENIEILQLHLRDRPTTDK